MDNYHIRRADGTTAAERFFARAHETPFAQVLQRRRAHDRLADGPVQAAYLMPLAA